ncbi:MAG: DUF3419 family protein [Candidatus Woesearchaeota archaeon]
MITNTISQPKTKYNLLQKDVDSRLAQLSLSNFEDKSNEKYSTFASIYPFTTENLAGYLPLLDLKNKSVLTIGGSGDQIINASFFGSNSICAFDINRLAELYSELKFSALEKLSFSEYKDFLLSNQGANDKAMNFEVYSELREDMSLSARIFFDKMFEHNENNGKELRNSAIFHIPYDIDSVKIKSNTYLHSEKNYNIAKNSLPNTIKWINNPLQNLPSKLDDKFDVMLLSNIADYAYKFYNTDNHLEIFSNKCIKPLLPYLNKDGLICVAYVYDAHPVEQFEIKYRYQISNPRIRKEVFQSLDVKFSEHYFDSVIPEKKDAVVILQKQ